MGKNGGLAQLEGRSPSAVQASFMHSPISALTGGEDLILSDDDEYDDDDDDDDDERCDHSNVVSFERDDSASLAEKREEKSFRRRVVRGKALGAAQDVKEEGEGLTMDEYFALMRKNHDEEEDDRDEEGEGEGEGVAAAPAPVSSGLSSSFLSRGLAGSAAEKAKEFVQSAKASGENVRRGKEWSERAYIFPNRSNTTLVIDLFLLDFNVLLFPHSMKFLSLSLSLSHR